MAKTDDVHCSFCRLGQNEIKRMVAGRQPGTFICNNCVDLFSKQWEQNSVVVEEGTELSRISCSFHGPSEDKPGRVALAKEPGICICHRCVELCARLLSD